VNLTLSVERIDSFSTSGGVERIGHNRCQSTICSLVVDCECASTSQSAEESCTNDNTNNGNSGESRADDDGIRDWD